MKDTVFEEWIEKEAMTPQQQQRLLYAGGGGLLFALLGRYLTGNWGGAAAGGLAGAGIGYGFGDQIHKMISQLFPEGKGKAVKKVMAPATIANKGGGYYNDDEIADIEDQYGPMSGEINAKPKVMAPATVANKGGGYFNDDEIADLEDQYGPIGG